MPFLALVLVFIAAFIHASWNLMSKRAASAGPAFVFAYNLIACVAYAPWVAWLIAHGAVNWSGSIVACILASGLIHLAYSLCLQRGYQVADLSVVYPVARGAGPMFSTLAAFVIFGETPTLHGTLGLIAVIGGIGLISTQGSFVAFRRPGGQTGVRWGMTTGGLIACYTVVDAYGVKTLGIAPVVLDWFSNVLRFILLAPLGAKPEVSPLARHVRSTLRSRQRQAAPPCPRCARSGPDDRKRTSSLTIPRRRLCFCIARSASGGSRLCR